jgi:hypothetical protein
VSGNLLEGLFTPGTGQSWKTPVEIKDEKTLIMETSSRKKVPYSLKKGKLRTEYDADWQGYTRSNTMTLTRVSQ